MRSACIAIWCVCVCVLPCVQALVVPEGGIAHRSRSSPLRPAASTLHATSKVCHVDCRYMYVVCICLYTHMRTTHGSAWPWPWGAQQWTSSSCSAAAFARASGPRRSSGRWRASGAVLPPAQSKALCSRLRLTRGAISRRPIQRPRKSSCRPFAARCSP